MIDQPLVSIVIPCYNHEHFVQDCIQSVIDQTYQNIELIIIDDGSSDDSVTKIEEMLSLCKERFTKFEFRDRPNKGLSSTLNEAIDWCQGKYFSAIASDDLLLKDKVNIQVMLMEKNNEISALFGSVDYINENNEIKINNELKEDEYNFDRIILNDCSIYAPTQMMVLQLLKEIGGYDPSIKVEDWYMWLKMAEKGKVYCISNKLAIYRIHSGNSTRNTKMIYDNNMKTLSLYESHYLYNKAFNKITWIYIIWSGQTDRKSSFFSLLNFLKNKPTQLFSKNFLVYLKYNFLKIKNWY